MSDTTLPLTLFGPFVEMIEILSQDVGCGIGPVVEIGPDIYISLATQNANS